MTKASIDIGTNSVRLLVGELTEGGLCTLYKGLNTTRLGEGVHHSGVLSAAAIGRTVQAVAEFAIKAKNMGAEKIIAVATSAVRDAANGSEFVRLCHSRAGVDVVVLDGETEAKLSYAGATAGNNCDGNYLVVDIGGGSTELAYGQGGQLQMAHSVNLGAVRLSELFSAREDGVVTNLEVVNTYIAEVLASIQSLPQVDKMSGVGGTITSLAAIDQALTVYDSSKVQGHYLSYGKISRLLCRLAATPLVERRMLPGLQPARADIIVYGIAILAKVMQISSAEGLYVSEQDILEGLLICKN